MAYGQNTPSCDALTKFCVYSHSYPPVQVISSERAGMGKSEEIKYRAKLLPRGCVLTVPLHDKKVDVDEIVSFLWKHRSMCRDRDQHIIHIDVSTMVRKLHHFLAQSIWCSLWVQEVASSSPVSTNPVVKIECV